MYIDSLNKDNNDYALSSFNNTLICNQSASDTKSVTFPVGYDFDGQLSFKVLFVNGHNCANTTSYMTLNSKLIKVYSHGTLTNLPIHTMTENNATVYKSLQANTILELYYNASDDSFVVVGNPVIYSSSSFVIYADGDFIYKQTTYTTTTTTNKNRKVLLGENAYTSNCQSSVYVSNSCNITFNPSTGVLTATTFCGNVCGNASTATDITSKNTYANLTGITLDNFQGDASSTWSFVCGKCDPQKRRAFAILCGSDVTCKFMDINVPTAVSPINGTITGTLIYTSCPSACGNINSGFEFGARYCSSTKFRISVYNRNKYTCWGTTCVSVMWDF